MSEKVCGWCQTIDAPCDDVSYRDDREWHDISIAHLTYCHQPCACFLRPNVNIMARDEAETRVEWLNY